MALKQIELKKQAQVMLLRNISETLVNGSRGVVVDFENLTVKKENDLIEAGIEKSWMNSNRKLPVVAFANGETGLIYLTISAH